MKPAGGHMRPERQGLQMGMFCDYDQPIGFESELAFISDSILGPRLTIHTRWSYGGTRDGANGRSESSL